MSGKTVTDSDDRFCGFCFGALGAAEVIIRHRRYCSIEHADADLRKRDAERAIDTFETSSAPAAEQLELGGMS